MSTIIENKDRIGHWTSSEIVALTTNGKKEGEFGKPFYTYVQEKKFERKLKRALDNESSARPLTWGKLCEQYVFEHVLPLKYEWLGDKTFLNPNAGYHAGSPDALKRQNPLIVSDVKSPMTLKSFCIFSECKTIDEVRKNHPDGEKYYWQLVSNRIIMQAEACELIVFCPKQKELEAIRTMARHSGDYRFNWIERAEDYELPYLVEDCEYSNVKVIEFCPPYEDEEFLIERIEAAEDILLKFVPKPEQII